MSQVLMAGDVVEVRAYCQDSEQVSVNSFYFAVEGFAVTSTVADAAALSAGTIAPVLKPLLNNNAFYLGLTARVVNRPPLLAAEENTSGSGAGTGGAIALPRQVAGLISWYTERAGPGGRGRSYLPFPPAAADVLDGLPSAAYIIALQAFANALLTLEDFNTGGRTANAELVVYSRHSIVLPGTHAYEITLYVARNKWATQRRRGSFGKPNNAPF